MSINLRSTTKISLNDRFKSLRNTRNGNNNAGASTSTAAAIANRLNQRQGSVRNKRLALQMANRPSVQAALKIKNRSIKQRLGTKKGVQPLRRNQSVKSRLTLTPNLKKASPIKARLNRNNFNGGGVRQMKQRQLNQVNKQQGLKRPFLKKRPQFQQRLQLQQQPQPSTSNIVGNQRQRNPRMNLRNKVGLAVKKQMLMRGRKFNKFNKNNTINQNIKNNKQMVNRRAAINQRRNGNFVGKQKFVARGKFGAGARMQVRWQDKKNVNKDQLDKDLDAYMAKTKTNLDHDLDAYMAHM